MEWNEAWLNEITYKKKKLQLLELIEKHIFLG